MLAGPPFSFKPSRNDAHLQRDGVEGPYATPTTRKPSTSAALVVEHADSACPQCIFEMRRAAELLVIAAHKVNTQRRLQLQQRRGQRSAIDLAAVKQVSGQKDNRRIQARAIASNPARKSETD